MPRNFAQTIPDFINGIGHQRKCSERSNDFRSASLSGHGRGSLAGPLSATFCREQMQQTEALLNHLVGAGEHALWHVEAKRLGGLKVDHQVVLGRCLYREIGGLLALEDAVDIAGRLPYCSISSGP